MNFGWEKHGVDVLFGLVTVVLDTTGGLHSRLRK